MFWVGKFYPRAREKKSVQVQKETIVRRDTAAERGGGGYSSRQEVGRVRQIRRAINPTMSSLFPTAEAPQRLHINSTSLSGYSPSGGPHRPRAPRPFLRSLGLSLTRGVGRGPSKENRPAVNPGPVFQSLSLALVLSGWRQRPSQPASLIKILSRATLKRLAS